MNNGKKALLMLSGGRDSFLSACKLLQEGYQVLLVTYNNGHISQIGNVKIVADRLKQIWGSERIRHVGIHTIAQDIRPLLYKTLYYEPLELCQEYPNILISQVNCLACHTTMYFHSIAYCIAHEIETIAEGAREEQDFFIELPEMKERYEKLCQKYNKELRLPVYDLKSDMQRKNELARWGMSPKSYESQCWLGCPMLQKLTDEQRTCLMNYYVQEIEPKADETIQLLIDYKRAWPDGVFENDYT
jgi:7-cyano-7-deazaguanine synthase in queuosine biosynthesis